MIKRDLKSKINDYSKAQVSLFIVIGVLLLVVGIAYFLLTQTSIFQSPQAQSQEQISEILRFCVSEQLDTAISVLQFRGGRINTDPLETQMLVQTFGFEMYSWSRVPTIEDMELDLQSEVEEKSLGCIATNLQGLDEIYEITSFSSETFEVDITISNSRVEAVISMPLTIRLRGTDESWEYSSMRLDVGSALYTNFKLAQAIHREHIENRIFENLVLEQISMAKDYSNPMASVPTFGVQFSCDTPIWRADEIKYSILNLNENNFRFLQFEGTSSIENRFLGFDPSIREYFDEIYRKELPNLDSNIDVSEKIVDVVVPRTINRTDSRAFASTFRTFRVNGVEEEFIRPTQLRLGGSIPIPCTTVFSKVYDLDYDIIVEITSFESGEAEIFRLPVRIQIENSEPARMSQRSGILGDFGLQRNSQIICQEDNRMYPIDFVINEVSSSGKSPLFGVDVSFHCAGITCNDLGLATTQISSPHESRVEAQLPFCSNARIQAFREGYFHIDTSLKAQELGFEAFCEPSRVYLSEMIDTGAFEGARTPYMDLCMVRKQPIIVSSNNIQLFDIESGTTNVRPEGEFVVQIRNEKLDFSEVAYTNFDLQEVIEEIMVPAVENFNANISIMYYENGRLLSFYEFENQNLNTLFSSTFSGIIPTIGSGIESVEDFEAISSAYERGFLGVNFGFSIN